LDETDFPDPFPTGLLHALDVVWNAVKAEPAVTTPESAAAEPTETVGVCPVFVVVTPSKLQLASTMLAADVLRRFRVNINAAHNATKAMTIVNDTKRDRDMEGDVDLDIYYSSRGTDLGD